MCERDAARFARDADGPMTNKDDLDRRNEKKYRVATFRSVRTRSCFLRIAPHPIHSYSPSGAVQRVSITHEYRNRTFRTDSAPNPINRQHALLRCGCHTFRQGEPRASRGQADVSPPFAWCHAHRYQETERRGVRLVFAAHVVKRSAAVTWL